MTIVQPMGVLRPLASFVGLIACLVISHPLLLATSAPEGSSRLSLAITPAIQPAPGTIQLTVRVASHKDNRQLCVAIEGDTGYYRSSCIALDAEQAPITHHVRYGGLPEGQYTAYAELKDSHQVLAGASPKPFQVL